MQLPSPVTNIPCDVQCLDGQYFDGETGQCQSCEGGTFSTFRLAYNSWSTLPGQFKTYCSNDYDKCQAWQLKGTWIDSGKNFNWGHSTLSMEIVMYNDGNVTFEYEVDAEQNYDYLSFSVDGVEKLRESQQLTWKVFTTDLKKGHHELKWLYFKDAIVSWGEDKAKIQSIVIDGAIDVVTSCTDCPAGQFSKDGETSGKCTKCPAGTFNPVPGQTECLPCPPLQTSFGGAVKCVPVPSSCKTSDYFSYKTTCVGETQEVKYSWITPTLCNLTDPTSVPLPPTSSVPCDKTCPSGQTFISSKCEYCPAEQYSVNGAACSACNAGRSLASKVEYFKNFSSVPENWNVGCDGDCVSGWRVLGTAMDSGFGNGIATSWVEFPINVDHPLASAEITFQQSCLADSGSLQFWVNGEVLRRLTCGGCSTAFEKITLPLTIGAHSIRIAYETNALASQELSCNRIIVNDIRIVGGKDGGSTACNICPAGYVSEKGSLACTPCDAGKFSKSGDGQCSECPVDTFSYMGSSDCYPCGNGMISQPGSPLCNWKFNSTPAYYEQNVGKRLKQFKWQEMADALREVPVTGDSGETFYFNLDRRDDHVCPPTSFVCIRKADGSILDVGNSLSLQVRNQHLHIDFTNYNPIDTNGTVPLSVSMDLFCDGEETPFDPTTDIGAWGKGPQRFVEVFSYFGCPLCTDSDWEENIGQCENGKRKHLFVKIDDNNDPPFKCAKGVHKETLYTDCSNTAAFPIWGIFLIIIPFILALLVIVIVGIIVYCRYKKLQDQFELLVEDQDMGHEKL